MPEKTHWRKLYNPNYIGAWSLDDGKNGYKEVTATIAKIDTETITGTDGKRDDCGVAYFKENQISGVEMKPLVLNATMFKTLESLFKSPYKEDWEGRRITLYVERNVKAFGSVTDAIRIKKTLPREQGAPKCLDCGGSIEATEKMNAAQLVAFGQKRFGKALCEACLRKLMEPKQEEANKTVGETLTEETARYFRKTAKQAEPNPGELDKNAQELFDEARGLNEPDEFPPRETESGESEFERMMRGEQ
jgi:ribosomal protein L34E